MSMLLVSNEQSGHYLMHYRTKGSKNGVRLYQNPDGSLTPLGREHYGVGENRRYDRLESTITKNTSNASKHTSKAAEIKKELDKDETRMLKGKSHMSDADRTKLLKKYYKLNTKSLAYQRKAERGKYKLMKFLDTVYKNYQEPETMVHADSETNFKAFLDGLTEEQRNALYVIFDDLLPDESDDHLEHHGVKGMEHGKRQYQYEDGTYTPLGRIHYGIGLGRKKKKDDGESGDSGSSDGDSAKSERRKARAERREERRKARATKREQNKIERKALKEAAELERKNIRNLTDDELQARINRLNKEKQLDQLIREQSERGMSPLRQKASKLLSEAAENLAKQTLSTLTQKMVNKLGEKLDEKEAIDLGKYRDVDLFSLNSDELTKIQDAFSKAGQIAENRNKVFSNIENAERREKAKKAEEEKARQDAEKKAADEKREEAKKAAEAKAEEDRKAAAEKKEADKKAAEKRAADAKAAEEKKIQNAEAQAKNKAWKTQAENDSKTRAEAKQIAKAEKEAAAETKRREAAERKAETAKNKEAAEKAVEEARRREEAARKSASDVAASSSRVTAARNMLNYGYSIKQIAAALNLSESVVEKMLR
jgi:hypothetical protein